MINIRSKHLDATEISWFAPICNGDDRFLGRHDDRYRSSWKNASSIVTRADELGFRNVLCPSSYQVGQDTMTFVSALAPLTHQINLLPAVRCAETHPLMLGRAIATLDHILEGRLTLNIISSNLPGENMTSLDRYQRSREVIEILKQCWTRDEVDFEGQFYNFRGISTAPCKPYQQNGGPLLYFGGYSPPGVNLCAEHCDVYLMWPEVFDNIKNHMAEMSNKAAAYGREVDFGLRVHVICRETESEALQATRDLMQYVDIEKGNEIRARALDAKSLGVAKQAEMRDLSDKDGFVEEGLWTGIGRARSGCGAAIVGDPDQVLAKIQTYIDLGIKSFIFSGYPHLEECELFARYVMPSLKTCSLPMEQDRIPSSTPVTPLGIAKRK